MTAPLHFCQRRHPEYDECYENWILWRDTYIGGDFFIQKYLYKYDKLEETADFDLRNKLTYLPAFAASAVDEVKNSIFQRMGDIDRPGGSESYRSAVAGKRGGVDLLGSSMNYFLGQHVLPELLFMERVGIYVDMPSKDIVTLLDQRTKNIRPYIYMFRAEDVCNWCLDESEGENYYTSLLLRENYNVAGEYGMPIGRAKRYRHMYLHEDSGIRVSFYDEDGNGIDGLGEKADVEYTLGIPRIPFIPLKISRSLLTEAARYQIGLLNLASSDMNYAFRSNFPLYTEQQNAASNNRFARRGNDGEGTAADAETAQQQKIKVGANQGRAYPVGAERPGFIHPSSEPLKASMEKQEQLKNEIRQLVNLSVAQLSPTKQASAQSKQMDNQGLEAGLSYIGLELERAENLVAQYWAMYEGQKESASVIYPQRYSLKSDDDRRKESEQLKEMIPQTPSLTAQKELSKQLAHTLLSHKVTPLVIKKIEREIDAAKVVCTDPTTLAAAVDSGYLSKEYASEASNYPKDNIEKANEEHAERQKIIADSQATNKGSAGSGDPSARGVPDSSADPKAGAKERQQSKDQSRQAGQGNSSRGKDRAPGGRQ